MNDSKSSDPQETLRRLGEFLDEDIPTDEEARAICAEMGIDIPAVTARIQAMVDAHEAGLLPTPPLPLNDEPPPRSHVALRPTRAPGLRYRTRR
jgi:hypothetical protein